MRFTLLSGMLALGAVPPSPTTDSSKPYSDRRIVAKNGRDYLVIKESDQVGVEATFAIARAAVRSPKVKALSEWEAEKVKSVVVRKGDRTIARGPLPHLPVHILLSDRGRGFVTVDSWLDGGSGKVLNSFSADGVLLFSKTLEQMYSSREACWFSPSHLSFDWLASCWLDDDAGQVFLFANDGLIKVVDVKTGVVSRPGAKDLVRALQHSNSAERNCMLLGQAVILAVPLPVEWLKQRRREAAGLELLYLDAALAARGSSAAGQRFLRRLGSTQESLDLDTTIRLLPRALGSAAVPLMREMAGLPPRPGALAAGQAVGVRLSSSDFQRIAERNMSGFFFEAALDLGEPGRALLFELIESGPGGGHRDSALRALTGRPGAGDLQRIYRAARRDPSLLESSTADLPYHFARIGGPGFEPEMLQLLTRWPATRRSKYEWFAHVKSKASLPTLLAELRKLSSILKVPRGLDARKLRAFLGRAGQPGAAAAAAIRALQFQTGRAIGFDVPAWAKHLQSSGRRP